MTVVPANGTDALSKRQHVDEVFVKIDGERHYLRLLPITKVKFFKMAQKRRGKAQNAVTDA